MNFLSQRVSRRSTVVVLVVSVFALLAGVLWSGGVAEAESSTRVTWKVSSLSMGQKNKLSTLVSTNSPGMKTWSKSGSCTLTPSRKPTTLTMGATGSCTLTLKIAKSGIFIAKTSKKKITLITTVAPTTTTTVAPTTTTTVAPTTTTTVVRLAAPAFSLSSSSESKPQNVAIAGYTISSTGGAIASYSISPSAPTGTSFNTSTGLLSGTPTTVQDATVYTITATNATSSASRTFTLIVRVPCAQGGTCNVGDVGPGGGFVFYSLQGGTFTVTDAACGSGCRYLEAAPVDWNGGVGSGDPSLQWGGGDGIRGECSSKDIAGAAVYAIGSGFANTAAIMAACPSADPLNAQSAPAARAAACYQVTGTCGPGNYGQWFLPSLFELQLLDVSAVGELLPWRPGLSGYWSSSQSSANYAYAEASGTGDYSEGFKASVNRVRAVRAF